MPITARPGFNGAMTFRSWRGDLAKHGPCHVLSVMESHQTSELRAQSSLQWGHDLSVMERSRGSPPCRSSPRFNGAMTFRSWREDEGEARYIDRDCFNGAMTFRSWRGPATTRGGPSADRCCFNGAMTFRSWRVGTEGASTSSGFNGAMTFRSWRVRTALSRAGRNHGLQWGHDLSVMERCHNRHADPVDTCFNGAMTFRSWRAPPSGSFPFTLQWGHDLSVMESRKFLTTHGCNHLKSFNGAMTFRSWRGERLLPLSAT